jgi:hypothetical protein
MDTSNRLFLLGVSIPLDYGSLQGYRGLFMTLQKRRGDAPSKNHQDSCQNDGFSLAAHLIVETDRIRVWELQISGPGDFLLEFAPRFGDKNFVLFSLVFCTVSPSSILVNGQEKF